jgi:thioredoxin-related protein
MRFAALFIVLLTLAAGPSLAGQGRETSSGIRWLSSVNSALRQARSSNKLIMVSVFAEDRPMCERLDDETYTDDKVIRASRGLLAVRVDAEKDGKEFVRKYSEYIHGYPTILFLNAEGELEGKIAGFLPPDGFAPEMYKFIDLHNRFPKAEAKYGSGDRSLSTLATLVCGYAARDHGDKAEELLEAAEKAADGDVCEKLARAYNAVGDHHQLSNRFARAVPFFRKATKSTDPVEVTYARISIASCYLSERKYEAAAKELKVLLAMPNATPAYRKIAEQMLKNIEAKRNP